MPIYRYGDSLFQIGDLNIDFNYKKNIIYLLTLGNKFIPNYLYSKKDYFNYMLTQLDKSLLNLNVNMFFNNNSAQMNTNNICNSLDINLNEFKIDDTYFEVIYKNFRKNIKNKNQKV